MKYIKKNVKILLTFIIIVFSIPIIYFAYAEKQYAVSEEKLQKEIDKIEAEKQNIQDILQTEKEACYQVEKTREIIVCFLAYDELDIKHIAEWINDLGASASIIIDVKMNHYNLVKIIEAIKNNHISDKIDIIYTGSFNYELASGIKQVVCENNLKIGDAWINEAISPKSINTLIQMGCVAYSYPDNMNGVIESGIDETLLAYMEYIEMTVNEENSEVINGINECVEQNGTLALVFRPARGTYEGENTGIEMVLDHLKKVKKENEITIGCMSEIKSRIEKDTVQISTKLSEFSSREQELLNLIGKKESEIEDLTNSFEFK